MKSSSLKVCYFSFPLVLNLAASCAYPVSAQSFLEIHKELIGASTPHIRCSDIVAANVLETDRSWTASNSNEFDFSNEASRKILNKRESSYKAKGGGGAKVLGIGGSAKYEKHRQNSSEFNHEQMSKNRASGKSSSDRTQKDVFHQTQNVKVGADCSSANKALSEILSSTNEAIVQQQGIVESNETARLNISAQEKLGLEHIEANKKISLKNIQAQQNMVTFPSILNQIYQPRSIYPQQQYLPQQQQQYLPHQQQQQQQQFTQPRLHPHYQY